MPTRKQNVKISGPTEILWLAIIFFLPLFFWPWAYTSFEVPKLALFRLLTFALLVSFLLRAASRKTVSAPDIKALKWPLALLGLTVLMWIASTVLSPAPAVSFFGYYPRFQGLYTFINYLVFGAVVFLGLENREQVNRIFFTIALSALIAGILAFLQAQAVPWLNFWDVSSFLGRFFGTMGHPDYLAGWLAMVIPLFAAMLAVKRAQILAAFALVFSLAALYFTLGRAAWLGLFAALFVFFTAAARKMHWKKMFWALLAVPVALAGLLAAANLYADSGIVKSNAFLSRLTLNGENLRSVQTRLALWPQTAAQITGSPWYGYGLDSYAITFPAYAPAELNTLENMGDYPDRAHNLPLDTAVQTGLPGLLVFAGFLFAVFWAGARFIRSHKNDWLVPLAILSSLAGALTSNMFGFFVTGTWVYFWLLVAILLNSIARRKEYPSAFLTRKFAGKILSGAIILAGMVCVVTQDGMFFWADCLYRSASFGGDSRAYSGAASFAPQISFYSLREAEAAFTDSADAAPGAYDDAEAAFDHAGRLTGYDGFYYFYSGAAAASNAKKERYLSIAADKMPVYAAVYLEWGKALIEGGKYGAAAEKLEKYLALSPPYWLWKGGLGSRTPEDQERYRIFYKLNPDFNSVFGLLEEAYRKAGDSRKADKYSNLQYF